MERDEWDEFLSRADAEDEEMLSAEDDKTVTVLASSQPDIYNGGDLGEFEDNAEVLIQMARGESFNSLSSNGVWIESDMSGVNNNNSSSNNGSSGFMSKKRTLKSSVALSVPVANSVQDLTRAITGHPTLSHPLSLLRLKHQQNNIITGQVQEIDSLGLFFYGTPGDIKVEWNGKDDMMKIIEMKKILLDQVIFKDEEDIKRDETTTGQSSVDIQISHENLKLLAGSIPPNGKTDWLIPFTVTNNNNKNFIDLTEKSGYKLDPMALFLEYCENFVQDRLESLLEPCEHLLIIEDSLTVLVKTFSPPFNISVNFRGESHVDPTANLSNFLFYRQSNYSIEVDFDSLRVKSIKSFLPKFEQQNRVFLLLKALKGKLAKLGEGKYYLSHQSNTPFIKILRYSE